MPELANAEAIAKVDRAIRDHPERFDYQDVPDLKIDPAYRAAMDALQPDWVKGALAKAKRGK